MAFVYSLGGERSHQTLAHACESDDGKCARKKRKELVRSKSIPVCQALVQRHGVRSGHWVGWPYVHDVSTVAHCQRCACAQPRTDWALPPLACISARADQAALAAKTVDSSLLKTIVSPSTWGAALIDGAISFAWRATAADTMLIVVLLCGLAMPFTRREPQPVNLLYAGVCAGAVCLVAWFAGDISSKVPPLAGVVDSVATSAAVYAIFVALVAGLRAPSGGIFSVNTYLNPMGWNNETLLGAVWVSALVIDRTCESLERTLGSGYVQWLVDQTRGVLQNFMASAGARLAWWGSSTDVVVPPQDSYISHLTTAYHARLLHTANQNPASFGGTVSTGLRVRAGVIAVQHGGRTTRLQAPPMCFVNQATGEPRVQLDWALELEKAYNMKDIAEVPADYFYSAYTYAVFVFRPIDKAAPWSRQRPSDQTSHLPYNWKSIRLLGKEGLTYTLGQRNATSVLIPVAGRKNVFYHPRLDQDIVIDRDQVVFGDLQGKVLVMARLLPVESAVNALSDGALEGGMIYPDLEASAAVPQAADPQQRRFVFDLGAPSPVAECATCLAIESARKSGLERERVSEVKSDLRLPPIDCGEVLSKAEAAFSATAVASIREPAGP